MVKIILQIQTNRLLVTKFLLQDKVTKNNFSLISTIIFAERFLTFKQIVKGKQCR